MDEQTLRTFIRTKLARRFEGQASTQSHQHRDMVQRIMNKVAALDQKLTSHIDMTADQLLRVDSKVDALAAKTDAKLELLESDMAEIVKNNDDVIVDLVRELEILDTEVTDNHKTLCHAICRIQARLRALEESHSG